MTRYTWFRYLQWLLGKHKGSRKHQLIQAKTAIVHNRTRWTAQLTQDGTTVTAYQWLPTPKELPRARYRMKGRLGFPHPYLDPALAAADHPAWEGGPDESLLTEAIGATSRPGEPLGLAELKLRRKLRDGFRCQRCGTREHLEVHHVGPVTTTAIDDLITLCRRCHRARTRNPSRSPPLETKHLAESRMQGNLPVRFGERDGRIQARQQAHGAPVPTLRKASKRRRTVHMRSKTGRLGRKTEGDTPIAPLLEPLPVTNDVQAVRNDHCGRVWADKGGNALWRCRR